MGDRATDISPSISELPHDELAAYASELGLSLDSRPERGELLRLVRARQELLLDLDRSALLDVVVWARRPVRQSASKELLARHIATITKSRFDRLSDRGLHALAKLRGDPVGRNELRSVIEHRLKRRCGWLARARQKRRSIVGAILGRLLEDAPADEEYKFLPENEDGPSLKDSIRDGIEDAGVVGGIARKLRGVADQYVHEKLDEIERRIDRKLDEIDQRLAEWRDREISNRLRLIKITLISAIVVALVSLGYDYVKSRAVVGAEVPAPTGQTAAHEPSLPDP